MDAKILLKDGDGGSNSHDAEKKETPKDVDFEAVDE
jgi:hypothetical protein